MQFAGNKYSSRNKICASILQTEIQQIIIVTTTMSINSCNNVCVCHRTNASSTGLRMSVPSATMTSSQ